MASMKTSELVDYLDDYLALDAFDDNSQNGLQVEAPADVGLVALAVDGCQETIDQAVEREAELLLVHHGLFWGRSLLPVGRHFKRLRTLIEGSCGLYGVHLPLDAHADVGNNAQLARVLGLGDRRRFGVYHDVKIGIAGELDQPTALDALVERLTEETGSPPLRVLRGGSGQARAVGCISGGAAMMMEQVAEEGLDTFVTGEMDHTHYHVAQELGLNVIFGGHYATETLGVRALGRHLSDRFGLRTVFLDVPTGM